MTGSPKKIPRVSPKAYDYVKQVLDFGFHNAHSVGITARLELEFAERFGHRYGIAHCNGRRGLIGVNVGDVDLQVNLQVTLRKAPNTNHPEVLMQGNAPTLYQGHTIDQDAKPAILG